MTTIKVVHILVCLLLIQFQQSSSEIIQPESKEVPNETYLTGINVVYNKGHKLPARTIYFEERSQPSQFQNNQLQTSSRSSSPNKIILDPRMRRTPIPESYYLQEASTSSSSTTRDPEKLLELLVKMRIWESAILNHFKDRIDDTDSLVLDPMWQRLMQIRTVIQSLAQQWEQIQLQTRELDANRMKK